MATIADSIDISDFEPNCTDKETIGPTRGQGVPCRICWAIFGRLRDFKKAFEGVEDDLKKVETKPEPPHA